MTLSIAAKSVLSLAGTTMIYRNINNGFKILDISRPLYEMKLEDRQPFLPPNQVNRQNSFFSRFSWKLTSLQPDSFEAIVRDDYAIILRPKTIALYALDDFRRGLHPILEPLSPIIVHEFQWRIDSCHMQPKFSPLERSMNDPSTSHRPTDINIIIRYSSLFPWPVNLLHHYVLRPNHLYVPPTKDSGSSNLLPPTTAALSITSGNLPYQFPPVLSQTIVSPVRLFAITDMALGPYGTAVWVDSHTEDFYYHGEVGQRLAGLMLSPPMEDLEDSEIRAADQNTQASASIVFGVHETDDWNRVAIDEEEGRIAVGSVNGEIMIDDYVER